MSHQLPILPLPFGSVLLPAASIKIPVSGRSDMVSILAALSSTDGQSRSISETLDLGCVPLNSSLLGSDGLPLPNRGQRHFAGDEHSNPDSVDHRQLFMYGVVAKVSGLQGGHADDFSLTVEGYQRFRIDRFTQMRPHFAAEVSFSDDSNCEHFLSYKSRHQADMCTGLVQQTEADSQPDDFAGGFESFKEMSLELLELVRMNSFRPLSSTTLSPFLARRLEVYVAKKEVAEADVLIDFMASLVASSLEDKLRVLAQLDLHERLEIVGDLITRQINALKNHNKIMITTTRMSPKRSPSHNPNKRTAEALLLKALKDMSGLGAPKPKFSKEQDDEEPSEIDELMQKIDEAMLTPEALKVVEKELKRLKKMSPAQAEYGVCRNYIEALAEIPWSRSTEDDLGSETLAKARKQLDDDHYGLEKIKKRLLEYLAVLKLKQSNNRDIDDQISKAQSLDNAIGSSTPSDPKAASDQIDRGADIQVLHARLRIDRGPILLLVGPPGTGKTSLARSIANALGRKFYRLSLGGVRDEAEIRGHRRTYVAAMPGLIINGLRKVGVNNPVFLLDEIDKVGGSSIHGDPSAAMLEVLDPEQNYTFNDHYVNIPFDLSKVLFIATANSIDTISAPLLDRMETIGLSGYTTVEKRHIARRHLLPKQITSNGLDPQHVELPNHVLDAIITGYTREAGVRNLEREIGSVCRFKAVQYTDAKDSPSNVDYHSQVSIDDLEAILGTERFEDEIADKKSTPGIVTGLVAFGSSGQGSILFIEVVDMPGTGKVQLTGKLGDVLKESVEVALTWVKAHSFQLGLTSNVNEDIMKQRSIHVHCPSGAIPKDGPSAGMAHTVALVSLFSGKSVPPELAMTGEISLRGRVMPVGGIKEKLIGAHRAGVKAVLLPNMNRKDVKDVPREVRDAIRIVHVGHIWEAISYIWPEWSERNVAPIESRL